MWTLNDEILLNHIKLAGLDWSLKVAVLEGRIQRLHIKSVVWELAIVRLRHLLLVEAQLAEQLSAEVLVEDLLAGVVLLLHVFLLNLNFLVFERNQLINEEVHDSQDQQLHMDDIFVVALVHDVLL
jgi:hypothetical protein